jgi:ABC-type transport system involved in multi-copper enzyme maturation permease subunit
VKEPRRPPPKQKPSGWGNALLGWELLRVSRRIGALAIGRFVFGAALLGVLWVLWSANYSQIEVITGDVNRIAKELQRFAEAFSRTFFIVQLVLVLLMTPILVAGSVFEERDTRSGEVLLTTDLTRREIFYGKYLARMVQVMMVVAAGMPILAMTLLWGGVAIQFIAMGYVATFLCIFASGAIAASVAGSSETMRDAVLKSYAYIFVFDVVIFPASPFVMIPMGRDEFGAGLCCCGLFVPVQVIVTIVSLGHGLRWLRLAMLRQRRQVTTELASEMARRKPPVAEENPLVWKERHVGSQSESLAITITSSCVIIVLGVAIIVLLGSGTLPAGWVFNYALPLVVLMAATTIGLGAAGGVARERQKNTLIDLFMIPGGRREILQAKLIGAVWRGRWMLGAIAALLFIGVFAGAPAIAMLPLAIAGATTIAASAMLGIWLSVRCRTAMNANIAWIGIVAFVLIGTFLLADAMSQRVPTPSGGLAKEFPDWSCVVNPALTWRELAMTPDYLPDGHNGLRKWKLRALPDNPPRLLAPVTGVLLFAFASGGLWLLALRRFDREGRDE